MRIASLLASATEIVAFLGLAHELVGVSADSDYPPEVVDRLPVLNTIGFDPAPLSSREIDTVASHGHQGASLYHVDPDLLRSVRPELILTQEVCEVCSVARRDVDAATELLGYTPRVVSLNAVTLEQVFEDIETVARLGGVAHDPALLRARVQRVHEATAGLPTPRVFCMEWIDPPYCAGHWVPEMVTLAGGQDDLGAPGGPSREIAWRDVVAYAPEVLVLMPCSLSLERVAAEFDILRGLKDWDQVPAVQMRRVYVGHTDLYSRSGPRLVDGLEVLARMLHPERFSAPIQGAWALKLATDGMRLEPYL